MPRTPTALTRPLVPLALAGLTAASLLASAAAAGAAGAGRELNMTFGSGAQLAATGNTALTVRTVTRNGGQVTAANGPSGGAIRLPAYRASTPPLAVLAVTDQQGVDDLAPGTARFRFGADFAVDAQSQGSRTDNGNNLVQRGLWGQPMQYKIEIDGNRPLCRVKGGAGAVSVRSSRTVAPGVWHRAVCERAGSKVTLTVTRLTDGTSWTSSATGATGAMRPASRSVPLSVGGKLDARGSLVANAPDQFNGIVDNAFVNVF